MLYFFDEVIPFILESAMILTFLWTVLLVFAAIAYKPEDNL